MKTIRQFFEDIGERRALLKQRQSDQAAAFKKRSAQRAQSTMLSLIHILHCRRRG